MSEEAKQQLEQEWSTFPKVEAMVLEAGFMDDNKPNYPCPRIVDSSLTTMSNREFSTIYYQLLAWRNYISPILARVKCRLLEVQNQMNRTASTIRKGIRDSKIKMTKEEREDAVQADPYYTSLSLVSQELEQQKLMLVAFEENIGRSLRVISRQVEIRKSEIEQSRMEGNLPGRGRMQPDSWGKG